jgi:sodium/potassium-transporting ATPase subunit alpha
MGRSGTDVAREAADMVLLDDNFASIVAAIEEGRAVFANIRNFLTYILTSNVPELIPYLAFVVFRIPLPLTIIQILAVDLGTDMLPALGLGAEKPAPDIMKAPPRSRADRLLDWPLLARAYLFLCESWLKSQTRYRRDFNRTSLRLEEERGRRDRQVPVRG